MTDNVYVIINEDNVVVNTIIWDGKSQWKPPEGHFIQKSPTACIGDSWNNETKQFISPKE